MVDTSGAAGAARFEAAIEVAASVISLRRAQDAILDLVIAGNEVLELNAGRGLGDSLRALAYLAEAVSTESDDINGLAALLHARIARLASIILVFTHLDAQRRALLDELRAHGLPTLCLLVVSTEDADRDGDMQTSHAVHRLRLEHLAADLALVGGPA